jgi:hypothetical protein
MLKQGRWKLRLGLGRQRRKPAHGKSKEERDEMRIAKLRKCVSRKKQNNREEGGASDMWCSVRGTDEESRRGG